MSCPRVPRLHPPHSTEAYGSGLTLQALRYPNSQLVVVQTSGKASSEQSTFTTVHATFCCSPVASVQAHVQAKGPPFTKGASTGSSYAHGGAVGGAPADRRAVRGGPAAPAIGAVHGHEAAVPRRPLGSWRARRAHDEAPHIRACRKEAALVGALVWRWRGRELRGLSPGFAAPKQDANLKALELEKECW